MANKTKPRPQKEAAPAVSIADRINQVRDEAEAVIDARVDSVKAQHPTIPRDFIWLNQYALGRADKARCPCKLALQILSEKDEADGR
jgi:hypothetical protein